MAEKDPRPTTDIRLDMLTIDQAKNDICPDELNFFTETAKSLLDVDIKEPDTMARDLLMDRYTNHKPNFKDFAEAVTFIMNTQQYTERIENLVKYERILFFKQRPDLGGFSTGTQTSADNDEKDEENETDNTRINRMIYSNPNQIIYGQTLLLVLEKIIDAVDSKVCGENDDDYEFRRQQAAIEFVTSFYHLKCYRSEFDENEISCHQLTDNFLTKSFREAGVLMEQKQYKGGVSKYLDSRNSSLFAGMWSLACSPWSSLSISSDVL